MEAEEQGRGDKGVGLSWGLSGSFSDCLVRVHDASGIIQGAAETSEGKMEKKKVGPGRTGKLSRVIKTRLQQGGPTRSDWQKGRGLGGVCRVGMLWPKAALSPKSQRKLLPARDWLPWVRFPRPWSNQQRPGSCGLQAELIHWEELCVALQP